MNIPELRKLVSDEYATKDNDISIPKCSTQFTFAENEILIRIPIYECQKSPMPALGLICGVINRALPNFIKKQEDLRQDLLMAMEGKEMTDGGFHIAGIVASTSKDGGKSASAITEVRIRIRDA